MFLWSNPIYRRFNHEPLLPVAGDAAPDSLQLNELADPSDVEGCRLDEYQPKGLMEIVPC